MVGLAVAMLAFGPSFVFGDHPYWAYPRPDVKWHVIGYLHYVKEPWGWPLGHIRGVGAPDGANIIFLDTVPILSLVLKLLRPIVAVDRPFGGWLFFTYAIQGAIGAHAARLLGAGTRANATLAAIFAVTLPAFLFRFGHAGLSAHFFLEWAVLLVVLAHREPFSRRRAIEWIVVLEGSALTHPYLLAMCSALLVTWCATALRERRARLGQVGAAAAIAVMVAAGSLFVVGVLSRATLKGRATGYTENSFNPATLVLGGKNAISEWLHLDPLAADATGFQYEGYDYLGAGLLLLVVATFVIEGRSLLAAARRHAILLCCCLGFVAFALSNDVWIGRTHVGRFPLPSIVSPLTTQFRSCGRFVWPVTYAGMLFVVTRVARARPWILFPAAVLQVMDVSALLRTSREFTGTPEGKVLTWDSWRPVLEEHEELHVFPSYACRFCLRPVDAWAGHEIEELEFMAAERERPLVVNSAANPRPTQDCAREDLAQDLRPGVLVVAARRVTTSASLAAVERSGLRCVAIPDAYACSSRPLAGLAPARFETPGEWLGMADREPGLELQGPGWAPPDDRGAWMTRATLHFHVDPRADVGGLELRVDVDTPGEAVLAAEVDDALVATFAIHGPAAAEILQVCARPTRDRLAVDLSASKPGVRLRAARLISLPCETLRQ